MLKTGLVSWGGRSGRLVVFTIVAAAASLSAACKSTPAAPPVTADTWAVVDGRQITRGDVDKAYLRSQDPAQKPSDEEVLAAKLNLLNDMIVQDLLIARAGALKIEVPQTEIDTAFNAAKNNIPDDAFTQELARRGLTPDDMRDVVRRELVTQKVIAQEVGAKIAVADQEVTTFYEANKAQFNVPEEAYHIAQIVVTPTREPQPTNSTGDDAATPQAAVQKVQMLMERLKAGTSFRDLAMAYSEDPESGARGGDLGLVGVSRLNQAPPQLRDAVLNKAPGSVNVASAGGAHTLVLVVSHEQPGQRDLTTPGLRDRITETLRARKEQLLRAAYLTALRSDADVVNYLARRLVESKGQPPAAPAPAAK